MAKKDIFEIEANYKNKKNSGKSLFRVEKEVYAETPVGRSPLDRYAVYAHDDDPDWSPRVRKYPLLIMEEDGNGYRITRKNNPTESFYLDYGAAEELLLALKLDYEVQRGNEFRVYQRPNKSRKARSRAK